jgi:hypothetical protein
VWLTFRICVIWLCKRKCLVLKFTDRSCLKRKRSHLCYFINPILLPRLPLNFGFESSSIWPPLLQCIRIGGWTDGQSDFNIPSSQMRTLLKINLCWGRHFSTHYVTTTYIKLWITVTIGTIWKGRSAFWMFIYRRTSRKVRESFRLIRPGGHSNTGHSAFHLLHQLNRLKGRKKLKPRIFRHKI